MSGRAARVTEISVERDRVDKESGRNFMAYTRPNIEFTRGEVGMILARIRQLGTMIALLVLVVCAALLFSGLAHGESGWWRMALVGAGYLLLLTWLINTLIGAIRGVLSDHDGNGSGHH
jgi:hypothetical protein